jgi:hypothetical protein
MIETRCFIYLFFFLQSELRLLFHIFLINTLTFRLVKWRYSKQFLMGHKIVPSTSVPGKYVIYLRDLRFSRPWIRLCRVPLQVGTNVSGDHTASIFRADAVCSFETLVLYLPTSSRCVITTRKTNTEMIFYRNVYTLRDVEAEIKSLNCILPYV